MSTTTNVQQVKVNIMTQQMYDTSTKNPNEFYVISDVEYLENSAEAVNALGIQTLQDIQNNGASGALSLADGISLYKITPTGATTISFGGSTSATSSKAYTFELMLDMSSTAYAITWPTVTWQDNEAPDLSEAGIYFFAFRTVDGGTTWLGNLQGKW